MLDLRDLKYDNALANKLGLIELTPVERYKRDPVAWRFGEIPKKLQTPTMVEYAVKHDGRSLKFVSKRLITPELCEVAVTENGSALQYVPKQYVVEKLCILAVQQNGEAIRYVPESLVTNTMAILAVSQTVKIRREWDHAPIAYVPYQFQTADLARISIAFSPRSLKDIFQKFMTKELLREAILHDATAIEFVPKNKLTIELIELALSQNNGVWELIPECKKKNGLIKRLKGKYPDIDQEKSTESSQEKDLNQEKNPQKNDCITKIKDKNMLMQLLKPVATAMLPKKTAGQNQGLSLNKEILTHFGPEDDYSKVTVYYISDIHLEFQIQPIVHEGLSSHEIEEFLLCNIQTMIEGIDTYNSILMIAGDVSHSIELYRMFFVCLKRLWHGPIFSVLGNHELWDGHPEERTDLNVQRPLSEIIKDYCDITPFREYGVSPPILLQNALFIRYKNQKARIISETQILEAAENDLKDLCRKSTFIVLGGIGFSGRNPLYNAENGLYRGAIHTREEDKLQTEKFLKVYKKVKEAAESERVIILTHMPVTDWCDEPCNPKWVYINGHTHVNKLIKARNGTTIFSDNQIGYTPPKWNLAAFTVSGSYDPLIRYGDGTYNISSEMYSDFNRGRGISTTGYSSDADIYALKRNGIYMFLLKENDRLYLLEGGVRHRLKNTNISYYYENMARYYENVKNAIQPYHQAISYVSNEVRKFGGDGTIHGCIVDITFFCHLYLSPFNGQLMSYAAEDIMSRKAYKNVFELLDQEEPELKSKFLESAQKGELPLLGECTTADVTVKNQSLATIPEWLFGTEMYEPSRIMRSIQYIYDKNVIRIWKDEVLNHENQQPVLKDCKYLIEENTMKDSK